MLIKELKYYSYICDGESCDVQSQQYDSEESVETNVRRDGWNIGVAGHFCPDCDASGNEKRSTESDMVAFAVR